VTDVLATLDKTIADTKRSLTSLCEKTNRSKREQRQIDAGFQRLGALKTLRLRYVICQRNIHEAEIALASGVIAAQAKELNEALERNHAALKTLEASIVEGVTV
jgi:hypothetical protein